jgi:hypothetical protein
LQGDSSGCSNQIADFHDGEGRTAVMGTMLSVATGCFSVVYFIGYDEYLTILPASCCT